MKFGISSPGCQCPMEFTAFNAYAYHQQKLDDYVSALVAAGGPTDRVTQTKLLYEVGFICSELSAADIDYIEREVAKRL